MTVSHAHARNACAHEQSTNIESGAVQWHKQSEQLLDCERECEREKVCCIVIASGASHLCDKTRAERANTKQTICGIVA